MNAVMENIKARRSTRAFTEEQITREELDTLLEAAVWAPTGMNKQLWHFVGLRNAEKNLELARAVAAADNR
ncbi:MAG: nitroreductase family protein, partial [Butyricicoccus sp.]|nr:nitroreductase family protein [Butyricicoccus sp.]